MTTQTARDLLATSASRHKQSLQEHSLHMLAQIVTRLPITTLSDMVAHTIGTDEDGDSEATSDFLHAIGKERWGRKDWENALEQAHHRFDPEYTPLQR